MSNYKPRDRHTKRGRKKLMERIYSNRKRSRELGKDWDGGFHSEPAVVREYRRKRRNIA